jgi:hypothetical protein
MVAVKTLWGPAAGLGSITGLTAVSLNDSDNSVACVMIFPKDGTIDAIGVRCTAVTGNPPAYNAGLVTVDASGNPTTTNYGGSATETHDFTAAGWVWVTLTTPATAVAGEVAAARFWPTGSPPDGSNFAALLSRGGPTAPDQLPAALEFTTAWARNGFMPFVAARYDDGQIVGGIPIDATAITTNYNSGTTPDEVGNLFSVPFDCTCIGFRFWSLRVASTSLTCRLLDGAGSTLGSTVLDADQFGGVGSMTGIDVYFDPVSLSADTDYRATTEAMEVTNRTYADWTFPDTGSRNAFPEGARWQKTSRANGGAFTDDNTNIVLMALHLSDITVAGGGGGDVVGARRRVW